MRFPAALLSALAVAVPAAAQPLLQQPIDCTLGETCHIQSYVDLDPGPGALDFACGPQTYDGHKGTDFALSTHLAMQRGVAVRAAAAGVVTGTRDGMADRLVTSENRAEIEGRECGNGVVIDHGEGWVTQYCHMRRGSIAVKSGQKVDAGTELGEVGLSGLTEFPHVHLSVRHDGKVVDPFRTGADTTCGDGGTSLWADDIAYVPGGLIRAGFDIAVPAYEDVKFGNAGRSVMPANAPALVLFGFGFGGRPGDQLEIAIAGPQGTVLEQTVTFEKNRAQWFRAIGRRTGKTGWPTGAYMGRVTLIRDGETLDTAQTTLTVQ